MPAWAETARNPTAIALDGIKADNREGFSRLVRQESPPGCHAHNLFFEASELNKGRSQQEADSLRTGDRATDCSVLKFV